jgi:hypothetical protein
MVHDESDRRSRWVLVVELGRVIVGTVEILKAARALIEDPERWTQHEYAVKGDGSGTFSLDVDARQWCATGALQRVLAGQIASETEAFIILESAAQDLDVDGIIGVNDELGHAAVMQMYNKAIEIAQKPWVPHQNSRS